jgi:hypothetical protein
VLGAGAVGFLVAPTTAVNAPLSSEVFGDGVNNSGDPAVVERVREQGQADRDVLTCQGHSGYPQGMEPIQQGVHL